MNLTGVANIGTGVDSGSGMAGSGSVNMSGGQFNARSMSIGNGGGHRPRQHFCRHREPDGRRKLR